MKDRHPPIDDVAKATSWWARFEKLASSRRAEGLAALAAGAIAMTAGRWSHIGRP
jgi:hypothetical protein